MVGEHPRGRLNNQRCRWNLSNWVGSGRDTECPEEDGESSSWESSACELIRLFLTCPGGQAQGLSVCLFMDKAAGGLTVV